MKHKMKPSLRTFELVKTDTLIQFMDDPEYSKLNMFEVCERLQSLTEKILDKYDLELANYLLELLYKEGEWEDELGPFLDFIEEQLGEESFTEITKIIIFFFSRLYYYAARD